MAKTKALKNAKNNEDVEESVGGKSKNGQPKAMWKGSISFGLVNIPVRMYAAYRPKNLHFHMLHDKDKSRIHQKIECAAEDKEIDRDETVKGFEVAPGQHVIVSDEELEALAPKGGRAIELIKFVDLEEIDPIYYDRPYYLLPEETAFKAYSLFVNALTQSKKVGLAKFVLRSKEYLSALRIINGTICLETMHYHDEIVQVTEFKRGVLYRQGQ